MKERDQVIRATGVIGLATLASRILGFARDIIIAGFFGAGMAADAFFVAFRIPNLLRRLLGEGGMNTAFIPVFTDYQVNQDEKSAWKFASITITSALVILIVVSALGIWAAPGIIKIVAPGFVGQKYELTVLLTQILFPYIFFIGLVSILGGILNSLGHFLAPALSPVLLNVGMIACVLGLAGRLSEPIVSLAIGVIAGGVAQLLFQLPFVRKQGMVYHPQFNWRDPGLNKVGRLLLPTVVGLAVAEVNSMVDIFLASFLSQGSVSYLYYGNRLVQFPLGVFGAALGTAILPTLSQAAAERDLPRLKETFSFGLRLMLFITIPAMVGLVILAKPIIMVLFERGRFGPGDTAGAAGALLWYSMGLWAFAGVKVAAPVFYSLQDTKTPVRISIVCMIFNIILNLILMKPMGHGGLALATSLASMLNIGWLVVSIRRWLGRIDGRRILASLFKTVQAAAVMGLVTWGSVSWLQLSGYSGAFTKALLLLLVISGSTGVYIVTAHLLGCDELKYLRQAVGRGEKPPFVN